MTGEQMDCQECGQSVGVTQRHTFVDCALYVIEVKREAVADTKYTRALASEVHRLRTALAAVEEKTT